MNGPGQAPSVACPRCSAPSPPGSTECPRCGVVFAKLAERRAPARPDPPPAAPPEGDGEEGWLRSLRSSALHVEPRVEAWVWRARAALLLGLTLWSLAFFRISMQGGALADSLMHLVHLPFHEGGHVVFMPLGWFLTALGGSLMQVLVPLACLVAFLRRKDPFAAAVALWWAGQSLMDVAPYVADARALQLVLIGGQTGAEVEGHDWEAVLTALGWINHDVRIGRAVNALGIVLMLAALVWGAWLLRGQRRLRTA